MTQHATNPTDSERVAVFDFFFDFAQDFPAHADNRNGFFVRASTLRTALRFVPDEFHPRGKFTAEERFVRAAVNEARATKRDPFNVAEFAFDLVPA